MYLRIAFCVFINYNMEMLKILGEYKLSIQNSVVGWPRRRWEDNIKMDLKEVGCDAGNWIDLAQNKDQW